MLSTLKSTAKALLPHWLCVLKLRPSAGNSVLLTFDDGPHPEITPAVLDMLRKFEARAIFFVVGSRIHRAPDMLVRILEEGHWVGNHSFAHANDRQLGIREYFEDLKKCQDAIAANGGQTARFHRPPHGQMTAASLLAPKVQSLITVNWSVSSEDWRLTSDHAGTQRGTQMAQEVMPRDILLFHDERSPTLSVLSTLLPELRNYLKTDLGGLLSVG